MISTTSDFSFKKEEEEEEKRTKKSFLHETWALYSEIESSPSRVPFIDYSPKLSHSLSFSLIRGQW